MSIEFPSNSRYSIATHPLRSTLSLFVLILLASGLPQSIQAQMLEPVHWEFSAEPVGGDTFTLIYKAKIDDPWKVYANDIEDGGPIATGVYYDDSSAIEFIGELKQLGKREEAFEPLFDMDLAWYKKRLILRQQVRVIKPVAVKGFVEYMTCDDKQCLPPTSVDFSFTLGEGAVDDASGEDQGLLEPIKWKLFAEPVEGTANQYALRFQASIDEEWKLYGNEIPEGGPNATFFSFEDSSGTAFSFVGSLQEIGDLEEAYEPLFKMDLNWFRDQAEWRQVIEVTGDAASASPVKGFLEFMTCDKKQCLPPTVVEFELDLASGKNLLEAASAERTAEGDCWDYEIAGLSTGKPDEQHSRGYFWIFLLGFGGGLVALLTPCVFPMIPLTVSFFTKGSENRSKGLFNAVFYGVSITLIYVLISVPFIVADIPPDKLNEIATNAWLNIAFFVVFLAFAISFFGYYEIQLPSSWANKADSASNAGGILGIFFMAVTLALVSFSCTGPILGSFLVGTLSANADPYNIFFVMLGFGLALGLPFAVFAAFPTMLKSLPKSGGWLNTVKVVLGFLELGLALKFLSNADLVKQWGLVRRETFLILWTLFAFGLAAYMMGWIKFPHDSPKIKLGFGRLATAAVSAAAGVYFLTGVFGANLGLISGFPPPMHYSYREGAIGDELEDGDEEPVEVFHDGVIYLASDEGFTVRDNGKAVKDASLLAALEEAREDQEECPLGIHCFHDYDEGIAYARLVDKPVMLDFTGWACVNCRRMEENVWVEPAIKKLLDEEYVLISLYVDEKAELPEDEQYYSCKTERRIRTVGNKWANLQIVNFNKSSQPLYALLSPDEKLLTEPVGYTPKDEYLVFLQSGLSNFRGEELALVE